MTWKERAAVCAGPWGFMLWKISPTSLWFYTFSVGNPPVQVLGELCFGAYFQLALRWKLRVWNARPTQGLKIQQSVALTHSWVFRICLSPDDWALSFPKQQHLPLPLLLRRLDSALTEALLVWHLLLPTLKILPSLELVFFPFHWLTPCEIFWCYLTPDFFFFFSPEWSSTCFCNGRNRL